MTPEQIDQLWENVLHWKKVAREQEIKIELLEGNRNYWRAEARYYREKLL